MSNISKIISTNGLFKDGDWVESKDQDPNGNIRLIQLADIGICKFKNRSNRFLTSKKSKILNCTILQHNDILVARMPDPLGRACLFFNNDKQCVTVVDIAIIRIGKNGSDPKWLMYIINCPQFQNNIHHLKSGTTRMRISKKNLNTIVFPVPPLNEQKRIASKIESIFTQIDMMEKYQKTVLDVLKKLKMSVLKDAFNGNLISHDSDMGQIPIFLNASKLKQNEYSKPKQKNIPKNWIKTTVGSICSKPQYGWTTSASNRGDLHLLRTTDITSGHINWNKVPFCKNMPKNVEKYILHDGDILISRAGSVGFSCLIKNPKKAIFASYLIRFKPYINEQFFSYFLQSPMYWNKIIKESSGIALANVNATKLKHIVIHIPPLNEQKRIVSKIETIFDKINNSERCVSNTIQSLNMLRQSVLKQAFDGKLVSQDPNDRMIIINKSG